MKKCFFGIIRMAFKTNKCTWVPLQRDYRGNESQLATNHLGHFQLTSRLWRALQRANGARVVHVSSFGHQFATFEFDDPNFEHREYETLAGYGQSKTANNLFTVELDRRGAASGIRPFSLHPGSVIGTDLGRVAPISLFQQMATHDENGLIRRFKQRITFSAYLIFALTDILCFSNSTIL